MRCYSDSKLTKEQTSSIIAFNLELSGSSLQFNIGLHIEQSIYIYTCKTKLLKPYHVKIKKKRIGINGYSKYFAVIIFFVFKIGDILKIKCYIMNFLGIWHSYLVPNMQSLEMNWYVNLGAFFFFWKMSSGLGEYFSWLDRIDNYITCVFTMFLTMIIKKLHHVIIEDYVCTVPVS